MHTTDERGHRVYSRIHHFANSIPLAFATHKLNDVTYMFEAAAVRHVLRKQRRKRKNEKRTHMHFSIPFLLCPFPKMIIYYSVCYAWYTHTHDSAMCPNETVKLTMAIWVVATDESNSHGGGDYDYDYWKHHRSRAFSICRTKFVYYEKIAKYDATTNILNSIL